ncbi:YggS family pyridoxal phosphate-dependent enzyme [Thiohalomonas denitrificans]|uniref:Pyridoxal phosphate homeostasis protein n=1 Tax=Thiohalomonas denitrificans TaxID=415747 RepID=A0A1G5QJY2_9GAMM|nr:YggS family pyridoxal phosphate-dependent enzyme [Thiohalomonas denitrificans]SCZ61906.1 hypothetical protein SAMN03097708_02226 [Thiohalomonas denitrificans]
MTYNNDNLTRRLEAVRDRLRRAEKRFGREEAAVALVAVSKTRPAEAIRACAEAGQQLFGESYLQEATDKVTALFGLNLQWHFIGPIQSNKTRPIAENFQWVHSVDRLKIARRLSEQRPEGIPPLNICLQVNVSGEVSKSGAGLDELPNLAHEVTALPNLRLRGLMCIPAPADDFEKQREPFRKLREAKTALQRDGLDLDTLSMGMSHDLEAAVAEGATMVRIGTAIFGPRNYR